MMQTIREICISAAAKEWKRKFGPFELCPVCLNCLSSCKLCHGVGKVIQEDIDAWNNNFAKMHRESN